MARNLSLVLLLICPLLSLSQSNYTISWGMSDYEPLTNFTLMGQFGEQEIDFGFSFPYYDVPYESIFLEFAGVGSFPGSENYNLFLFAGEYSFFPQPGGLYLSRFAHHLEMIGDLKVLKVEWKDVGIEDDITSDQPTDHRLNFQAWFFENGIIELHFGEIELANTPYHSDSTGFVWDDGSIYGPWIEIANDDFSEVYAVSGTPDEPLPIYIEDDTDIFYGVPPTGFFIRWTPDEVSSTTTFKERAQDLTVFPNPSEGQVFIAPFADKAGTALLIVFTPQGLPLKTRPVSHHGGIVDLTDLPNGLYYLSIHGEGKSRTAKVVLNR